METEDLSKDVIFNAYKLSLAKQLEENAKRLLEHYQKMQPQSKVTEKSKQDIHSFVCDWQ